MLWFKMPQIDDKKEEKSVNNIENKNATHYIPNIDQNIFEEIIIHIEKKRYNIEKDDQIKKYKWKEKWK